MRSALPWLASIDPIAAYADVASRQRHLRCCLPGRTVKFNRMCKIATDAGWGISAVAGDFAYFTLLVFDRRRARGYFAAAGNAGSLPTSRGSCWMMTVALRFAAIFLKRSTEASVAARSVLNVVTPLPS